jgi:hypothetical protein
MVYDPRGLPGVSIVGLRVDGVLQMVSVDPRGFTGVCGQGVPQQELQSFSAAPTIFGGQGRAAENKLLFSAV